MKGVSDHGTACCGLINSNGPFYGAAPDCRVLPVKCEIGVNASNEYCVMISTLGFLKLLNKLAPHVNVMSFSWEQTNFSDLVIKRINELATTGGRNSKGVLMVWAAGNDNSRLNNDIANLPNVALVGAICSKAYRSHYSNYGCGLTLCAPSNNTSSQVTDPLAQTLSLPIVSLGSAGLVEFGGTSAAAALV